MVNERLLPFMAMLLATLEIFRGVFELVWWRAVLGSYNIANVRTASLLASDLPCRLSIQAPRFTVLNEAVNVTRF